MKKNTSQVIQSFGKGDLALLGKQLVNIDMIFFKINH